MARFFRLMPLLSIALTLGVALAACGGAAKSSSNSQQSGGGSTVQVEVTTDKTGMLKWEKTEYTVSAGDVTFQVNNPAPVIHQFAVEGNGVNFQSPEFGPGTKNSYTIKGLKPGTYSIVCNVAGHKEAGMVAKLIVK